MLIFLIRAVLGTKVRDYLLKYNENVDFITPDVCMADAQKYLPILFKKRSLSPEPALNGPIWTEDQDFPQKYNRFVDFSEKFEKKDIEYLMERINGALDENLEHKKKYILLQRYADLEGVIHPMIHIDFSQKISDFLVQIRKNSLIVADYLTGTSLRNSQVTIDQYKEALDYLMRIKSIHSELECLFDKELKLRNFKFYTKKYCSKICRWCST